MKDGHHVGATVEPVIAMNGIANKAFAQAQQEHPQLAKAILASADVEAAIEANNINDPVTKHLKHNVLTLSHFGSKCSVGLNVYKMKMGL